MATTKPSLSHLERTAAGPRDDSLHTVRITDIQPVNNTVRLFQLTPTTHRIRFLPGQWLDVYCPGIPKAGGFTITSHHFLPHLELVIQKSPKNPPAAWLWQSPSLILNSELRVRVGGSFVWPPFNGLGGLRRVVFVAGGVGINPLMSMVSSISELLKERQRREESEALGYKVTFLYSTREMANLEEILFLRRLMEVFKALGKEGELRLFLTGGKETRDGKEEIVEINGEKISTRRSRITDEDVLEALGPAEERSGTTCYICGVPMMTDEFVDKAMKAEGMLEENVLFEKWW